MLSFSLGVGSSFIWLNFELTKTKHALALANQMVHVNTAQACSSSLPPKEAFINNKTLAKKVTGLLKKNENLIDVIPEQQLTEFMGYMLKTEEMQGLDNPRQFAKRFAQELMLDDAPVSQLSQSNIVMSLSSDGTKPSITTFEISPTQKIYAHINVGEGVGLGDERLFVRWVNLDMGDVMLFDRKRVKKNQPNNWVSLKPEGGWKDGNYQVTYYRFDSALTKLATAFYSVQIQH